MISKNLRVTYPIILIRPFDMYGINDYVDMIQYQKWCLIYYDMLFKSVISINSTFEDEHHIHDSIFSSLCKYMYHT